MLILKIITDILLFIMSHISNRNIPLIWWKFSSDTDQSLMKKMYMAWHPIIRLSIEKPNGLRQSWFLYNHGADPNFHLNFKNKVFYRRLENLNWKLIVEGNKWTVDKKIPRKPISISIQFPLYISIWFLQCTTMSSRISKTANGELYLSITIICFSILTVSDKYVKWDGNKFLEIPSILACL